MSGGNSHSHIFLGTAHEKNERRTWSVIALCSVMMLVEIGGGSLFGSLAVVADGLHMSTHAAALLIAAIAYTYARRRATDPRFAFGTGKFGDLAGFSSAIILAMIALFIGYEAISRLFGPIEIAFDQAIPIAGLGLLVNIASAWLLGGDDVGHSHGGHSHGGHGHGQGHGEVHAHGEEVRRVETSRGPLLLEIFEDGVPPRFRLRPESDGASVPADPWIETLRPDGTRQRFALADQGAYLESVEEIPEPHEFTAVLHEGAGERHEVVFIEHHHGATAAGRDNNMRAAFVHVLADAAVSVLAITGLLAGRFFGWVWMDPVMGIVGAVVIANWSYGLIRDTGAILLDMTPDPAMAASLRAVIEAQGDQLTDLHLWRLGPGHLGAIVSIVTREQRGPDFYRTRLSRFSGLSHLTIEVRGH